MKPLSAKRNTLPIFILSQFSVVGLFIFIMILALARLEDVRDALTSLSIDSVPNLNKASIITKEIQHLVALTTNLTFSNDEPSRRIVKQNIQESLNRLNSPSLQIETQDDFLFTQLNVLSQELEELNSLIVTRIQIDNEVTRKTSELFDLIASLALSNAMQDKNTALLNKLLISAAQVEQQQRLHILRQLEETISIEITKSKESVDKNSTLLESINNIEVLLLSDDGLINKKIEALRISGRAKGRGNFVRNLVEDVARSIEIETEIISRNTLEDSQKATRRVYEQTQITIVTAIVVIVMSFFVVYYLYRRIVLRLISLTRQVEQADDYKIDMISIGGDDEIARLGKTFSLYLNRVKSQEEALLLLTLSDPLTGIANRRAFEKSLQRDIAQARRNRWSLSIMMIDVDYFKKYNDHYGHAQGDECLKIVAQKLDQTLKRTTDFCARFGGEEFIAILSNTGSDGAISKAETLRQAVENLKIMHAKSDIANIVTVSIGVATFEFTANTQWSADTILEETDKALYKAKAAGRNQCVFLTAT